MGFKGKVGILGGTFDPVHTGHIALAEAAVSGFLLGTVILMPSDTPYYKDKNISGFEDRLNMAKLAVKGHPNLAVSDFEQINDTDGYTYNTLLKFKQINPEADVYFIAGGDSLFSMESWKNINEIFKMCTVLVNKRKDEAKGQRGNLKVSESVIEKKGIMEYTLDDELDAQIAYLAEKYNASIFNIHARLPDVSSSEIRKAAASGRDISGFVCPEVAKYIQERLLYI